MGNGEFATRHGAETPVLETAAWFAIQAKPAREEIAATALAEQGFGVCLPRAWQWRTLEHCRRRVRRPFFPGYLFGRFDPVAQLRQVRYSRGVAAVVSAGPRPLPVEDEVIQALQSRMDGQECIDFEAPAFRRGDRVRIRSGPFEGLTGVFEQDLSDRERVLILLEVLARARVILERSLLEAAA